MEYLRFPKDGDQKISDLELFFSFRHTVPFGKIKFGGEFFDSINRTIPYVLSLFSKPQSNPLIVYQQIYNPYEDNKRILLYLKNPGKFLCDDVLWFADAYSLYRMQMRLKIIKIYHLVDTFSIRITFHLKGRTSSEIYSLFGFEFLMDANDDKTVFNWIWCPDDKYSDFPDILYICNTLTCLISFLRLRDLTTYELNEKIEEHLYDSKYVTINIAKNKIQANMTIKRSRHNTFPVVKVGNPEITCNEDICSTNSKCTINEANENNPFKCVCNPGFTGFKCEIKTKCVNCQTICNSDYTCDKCKFGWEGKYCEKLSCSSVNPCQNGAKCIVNLIDKIHRACICPIGFKGRNCEIIIPVEEIKDEKESTTETSEKTQSTPSETPSTTPTSTTAKNTTKRIKIIKIKQTKNVSNDTTVSNKNDDSTKNKIIIAIIVTLLSLAFVAIYFIIKAMKEYERKMLYADAIK